MKLKEVPHIVRLPGPLRGRLLPYTLKKTLRLKFNNEEKEANIALRILAGTDSSISKIDKSGLGWKLKTFGRTANVVTRRYPSSDMGIMLQIFGHEEYKPAVEILSRKFGDHAQLKILDAGANIGLAALYFKMAFPQSSILCLEIDDSNVAGLVDNTAALTNITVNQEALWKSSADLEIKRDFRTQTECSYYVEESTAATGLTGHHVKYYMGQMGWPKVDLLKIDIEGSERYLFESGEMADSVLATTDLLAMEIHDEYDIRAGIYEHLERNGFQHLNHGDLTIAFR
jgi:FkbM family methyltransferase